MARPRHSASLANRPRMFLVDVNRYNPIKRLKLYLRCVRFANNLPI